MLLRGLLLLANWTGLPRLLFKLVLDRRVPLRLKLMLAASLIYVFSPLDFVPDLIPVLGWGDDLLVLILGLALFLGLAPAHVVAEHVRSRFGNKNAPTTIEGEYRVLDDEEQK